jgi:hypothetical protein
MATIESSSFFMHAYFVVNQTIINGLIFPCLPQQYVSNIHQYALQIKYGADNGE